MNAYQTEQMDALNQIVSKIGILNPFLDNAVRSYLSFRRQLDDFSERHFSGYCNRSCFESRSSICCSKDGIITFWADVVINVANSDKHQIDELFSAIEKPMFADKCIYLGANGCRWHVRPLGCALFLCDQVQEAVLAPDPALQRRWETYLSRGKAFRWPDRPVLFDQLEQVFMNAGCRSSLMYINTSPGLLRVKQSNTA